MATQMVLRIDPELKDKFTKLARQEGKAASQMLRKLMEDYINERDIGTYIEDLWERTGQRLKEKGLKEKDIDVYIKEVRKGKS